MRLDEIAQISCAELLDTAFADRLEAALSDEAVSILMIDARRGSNDPVTELDQMIAQDPTIDRLRILLRTMEQGPKPVIGLVTGPVEGLGLEVILGCHVRFANADDYGFGFPWLQYGLMPVLGGTQRLAKLCGIQFAVEMLMMGKTVGTAEAAEAGLFQIVNKNLVDAGLEWAESHPDPKQPWDKITVENSLTFSQSSPNRQLLEQAYLKMRRRISPEEAAPTAILRCLYDGLERSMDAGIRLEAEQWAAVRQSTSTLNRINTLYRARRKMLQRTLSEKLPIVRVGVLGAGLMGTGIAYTAARAGFDVQVVEVSNELCEKSLKRMQNIASSGKHFDRQDPVAAQEAVRRVNWSSEIRSLVQCDLIIEAIFEDETLKKAKIAEISAMVGSNAIIASNTTTLPISNLATACTLPERFIGTHFFAPVDRMELLEVVVGDKTAPDTLNAALLFGRQLGKTSVVVRDGPGFFTSRVVAAYLQEALFMVREGVSPSLIDNVAQNAGMILGPLAVTDLMSLDLFKSILESLARYRRGSAINAADGVEILNKFINRSRLGRKTGAGIYDYNDLQQRVESAEIQAIYPLAATQPSPEEIERRLFTIQSIEALRAIGEGIIEDRSAADLASVLGWSYPAFRGGVITYIESIGRPEFERICSLFQERFGDRFAVPS